MLCVVVVELHSETVGTKSQRSNKSFKMLLLLSLGLWSSVPAGAVTKQTPCSVIFDFLTVTEAYWLSEHFKRSINEQVAIEERTWFSLKCFVSWCALEASGLINRPGMFVACCSSSLSLCFLSISIQSMYWLQTFCICFVISQYLCHVYLPVKPVYRPALYKVTIHSVLFLLIQPYHGHLWTLH